MQRYQQGLPRRAWEPVIPTLRIPRSHAPRGNPTVQQGLPRRAWEPGETGGNPGRKPGRTQVLFPPSNAPRSSFQRQLFLVPTLRVGTQRYQQGLPRRAWEPVIPTLRIPRSHAPRGNATVPARTTTPSVGASETYSDHQLLSTGSSPSLPA